MTSNTRTHAHRYHTQAYAGVVQGTKGPLRSCGQSSGHPQRNRTGALADQSATAPMSEARGVVALGQRCYIITNLLGCTLQSTFVYHARDRCRWCKSLGLLLRRLLCLHPVFFLFGVTCNCLTPRHIFLSMLSLFDCECWDRRHNLRVYLYKKPSFAASN